jgi:hypothetical protein
VQPAAAPATTANVGTVSNSVGNMSADVGGVDMGGLNISVAGGAAGGGAKQRKATRTTVRGHDLHRGDRRRWRVFVHLRVAHDRNETPDCAARLVVNGPDNRSATWDHPHPPCAIGSDHVDTVIEVVGTSTTLQFTCRFQGAAESQQPCIVTPR